MKRYWSVEELEDFWKLLPEEKILLGKKHGVQKFLYLLFLKYYSIDYQFPECSGESTTACAADSRKFTSWDQNLMTEWHARYKGAGVMIYWHVTNQSICIHSQLKTCSSSEVASMLQGVLSHGTDIEIESQYVDSHGKSELGFALTYLLGFDLLYQCNMYDLLDRYIVL